MRAELLAVTWQDRQLQSSTQHHRPLPWIQTAARDTRQIFWSSWKRCRRICTVSVRHGQWQRNGYLHECQHKTKTTTAKGQLPDKTKIMAGENYGICQHGHAVNPVNHLTTKHDQKSQKFEKWKSQNSPENKGCFNHDNWWTPNAKNRQYPTPKALQNATTRLIAALLPSFHIFGVQQDDFDSSYLIKW